MRGVIEMIDIRIDCDECKTGIDDGDDVYCEKCVYNKDLKIESLEEEVARLKKEMVDIRMRGEKTNEQNIQRQSSIY